MTHLTKDIIRSIDWSTGPGRLAFVIRVAPEGVYFRTRRQRRSSELFCSWGDAYLGAALRKARDVKKARAERRKMRRLGVR